MQKSAIQLKIEAQLQASVDLLKQAKRYVGQSNTIGGQDLSREITEFVASVDRNPATPCKCEVHRNHPLIRGLTYKCIGCGKEHPGSGNLPCPNMIPRSQS